MIIVIEDDAEHGCEQRHGHAPEDLPLGGAVGARRLEHVSRHRREPGADHDHGEAGPDPDVGDQQRRRDQVRPEPGEAAERLREGLGADRRLVAARRDVRELERAVRRRLGRLDGRSRLATRSSTVTPGRPSSPLSTTPRLAAARREVAPDDADDLARLRPAASTACTAPFGTDGRRRCRSAPSRATPPGASGVFSTSAPDAGRLQRVESTGTPARARRPG